MADRKKLEHFFRNIEADTDIWETPDYVYNIFWDIVGNDRETAFDVLENMNIEELDAVSPILETMRDRWCDKEAVQFYQKLIRKLEDHGCIFSW